ncbi:hypothetical protein GCM10023170_066690 [Phytohabitans houttuyneae]|uniref:Uncharacterized protein n=1 Tax=Phytohabitans houttuyneae TaxID=1076126 RepID=A0A6V8KL68_9ACTN|nr:hypothetical protein Phou_055850 [Phytohabitans houttuyneae]
MPAGRAPSLMSSVPLANPPTGSANADLTETASTATSARTHSDECRIPNRRNISFLSNRAKVSGRLFG